jgi:adenylate cyclase
LLIQAVNESVKFAKQTPENLLDILYRDAIACGKRAIALDEADSFAHVVLGEVYVFAKLHDLSALHLDRSIALNPSNVYATITRAFLHTCQGRPADGLQLLDLARLRDPLPNQVYWLYRATTLYQLRRYAEALDSCKTAIEMGTDDYWQHAYAAACLAMMGQAEPARTAMAIFRRRFPEANVGHWIALEPYTDQASLDHIVEGMRRAGLPER